MAATRFDFGTLRELFVRVRGAQLPQVAMVNIKLISPRGVVHYETNAWFSTDPAVKSMDMGAGAPAATVHLARKIPGGFALDLPIPVSGTVLARYPKTGTWQVAAAIDGIPRTFSSPMDVYISGN